MDPMRRYGIPGLDAALAKLDDHDQLERERSPFSLSPASFQSGSTGFDDPNMPEPDPLAARKIKLEFHGRRELALEAVKNAWLEQGIWRPNWNSGLGGTRWKHEGPLRYEGEIRNSHRGPAVVVTNPVPRELENGEERRRRRVERHRNASRPLPQFICQVEPACDGLAAKHQQANAPAAVRAPPDLGSAAYDEVKERWIKWGIWNNSWGTLPARTWLHEHPFEDLLRDELPPKHCPSSPRILLSW
ncbi:hypothetical protein B0T24DRAFT_596791 [Lasiosphaeria ovina]|uniref:Uncharacterized protein n=1 Tax=Lasiosphaeria ovina TaxID=92902 RepID=A0AAE0JYU5_9PEZI|nr:hypothetical protein B0T24DRAFT_596791 [Lasiosphaeria ovina]